MSADRARALEGTAIPSNGSKDEERANNRFSKYCS